MTFSEISNLRHLHCTSPWYDQGQPDYSSHVESRELFEFGEEMKFVVVLEASFIAKLIVSSYMYLSWCYYIVESRHFIPYYSKLSVY